MDARKDQVHRPHSGLNSKLDLPVHKLKVVELDQILFDSFVDVSQTDLRKFRQAWRTAHPDRTVAQCLKAVLKAKLPKKNRKPRKRLKLSDTDAQILKLKVTHETFLAGLQHLRPGDTECCVCFENFSLLDVIMCPDTDEHPLCRQCLHNYLKTCERLQPDQIPCAACRTPYLGRDMKLNVSELTWQEMERNAYDQNLKVAFGGGVVASLYCDCGTVAVVMESDLGDGTIKCTCGLCYCCKCGNIVHSGEMCPPASETLRWIDKYAKTCPNCGDAVQKNGGCNHFTHARGSGGCGHEFCWHCLCDWRRQPPGHAPGNPVCKALQKSK